MSAKTDAIEQSITDKVIALIESGELPPWRKPWVSAPGQSALPENFSTGNPYRGINTLNFWIAADEMAYSSNAWMTYKQGQAMGANVRRGEKGTHGVYMKPKKEEDTRRPGHLKLSFIPCPFNVFNIDQFDGLERPDLPSEAEIEAMIPPQYATCPLRDVVQAAIDTTGLTMRHGGGRAFYSPSRDHLQMPLGFDVEGKYEDFALTLAHELVHATGHNRRLDRFAKSEKRKDVAACVQYHYEELVAELGSIFLCAELGVPYEVEQSAAYLQGWLRGFKNDPKFLPRAAGDASRAARYLAAGLKQPDYSEKKDQEPARKKQVA